MGPKRKRKSSPASVPETAPAAHACDAYRRDFATLWRQRDIPRLEDAKALLKSLPVSPLPSELLLAIRDQVVQDHVLSLMHGHATDYASLFDTLDAVLWAAATGVCTETLPHTTLELLFETEAVQDAEKLFGFVESRSDMITAVGRREPAHR
jgi:hypothetical protein